MADAVIEAAASTEQAPAGVAARRPVGTLTSAWWALADGLGEARGTQVALASPGESWQPVSQLLEGLVTLCRAPASQGTTVPGCKPAPAEARWLANRRREGGSKRVGARREPSGIGER